VTVGSTDPLADQLGKIVGRLAHDLRNPLSIVLANVRFLAEQLDTPDLREAADESVSALERLNSIIEDTTAIVPLKTGQHSRPTIGELNLARLQDQVEGATQSTLGSKQLAWELEAEETPLLDAKLLGRAISALVHHSVRRSPPGATITIRSQNEAEQLVLQVIDEGPPFAPEHEPSFISANIPPQDEPPANFRSDGDLGLHFAGVAARSLGAETTVGERSDGASGLVFELRLPLRLPLLSNGGLEP
jgi:two-component system sensor histidine kinase KdpD